MSLSTVAASMLPSSRPSWAGAGGRPRPVEAGDPASPVRPADADRDVVRAQGAATAAPPAPEDAGAPAAARPHALTGRGAVRGGALVASCAAVAALLALDAPSEVRLPVVLVFLLVSPGLALVPDAWGAGRADWLVLVIATSIAVDTFLGLLLVLSAIGVSEWSAFAAVTAACAAGVVARELAPRLRRASGGP